MATRALKGTWGRATEHLSSPKRLSWVCGNFEGLYSCTTAEFPYSRRKFPNVRFSHHVINLDHTAVLKKDRNDWETLVSSGSFVFDEVLRETFEFRRNFGEEFL